MSQLKSSAKKTCWNRFLDKVDIFSYIPVPQSFPVSTRSSKIGSLIVLILFFGYIIYDFVMFIISNTPAVNSYGILLPSQQFSMPNIAIGFIYGSALNQTLTNQSYFNFTLQQSEVTLGKASKNTNLSLIQNCQPSWLGNLTNTYQNLSCLDPQSVKLQGVALGTPESYYPRIQVNLCNNISSNCSTLTDLMQMTSGGRLFVFIERGQVLDFKSGKLVSPPETYTLFTFFLVPFLYNRVNVILQYNSYEVYPNFFTSFTQKQYPLLQILNTEFQNSNVSIYNSMNTLSVNFMLSPKANVIEVHYSTIIQHVSLWGALWGVLFSLFAIFFLGYNRNKFRKERPDWDQFDKKVDHIEKKIVVGQSGRQATKQTELIDISTLRRNLVTEPPEDS